MGNDLRRTGPRFTVVFDFNLQFLWPKVHGKAGLYFVHLGWFSVLVGIGKARDVFFDAVDRGSRSMEDQLNAEKESVVS